MGRNSDWSFNTVCKYMSFYLCTNETQRLNIEHVVDCFFRSHVEYQMSHIQMKQTTTFRTTSLNETVLKAYGI
jgi:hypothetical protein